MSEIANAVRGRPKKLRRRVPKVNPMDKGYRQEFVDKHSTLMVCLEYANKNNLTYTDCNTGYISFDLNMDNMHYLFASLSKLYHYCIVNKPETLMYYTGINVDEDIEIKMCPWIVGVMYKNDEIHGVRIMLYKHFVYEYELPDGEAD